MIASIIHNANVQLQSKQSFFLNLFHTVKRKTKNKIKKAKNKKTKIKKI